MERIVIFATLG